MVLVSCQCDVFIRPGQLGFSWPTGLLFHSRTKKPNPVMKYYDDMGSFVAKQNTPPVEKYTTLLCYIAVGRNSRSQIFVTTVRLSMLVDCGRLFALLSHFLNTLPAIKDRNYRLWTMLRVEDFRPPQVINCRFLSLHSAAKQQKQQQLARLRRRQRPSRRWGTTAEADTPTSEQCQRHAPPRSALLLPLLFPKTTHPYCCVTILDSSKLGSRKAQRFVVHTVTTTTTTTITTMYIPW